MTNRTTTGNKPLAGKLYITRRPKILYEKPDQTGKIMALGSYLMSGVIVLLLGQIRFGSSKKSSFKILLPSGKIAYTPIETVANFFFYFELVGVG